MVATNSQNIFIVSIKKSFDTLNEMCFNSFGEWGGGKAPLKNGNNVIESVGITNPIPTIPWTYEHLKPTTQLGGA
jgi:hypothetical protein